MIRVKLIAKFGKIYIQPLQMHLLDVDVDDWHPDVKDLLKEDANLPRPPMAASPT